MLERLARTKTLILRPKNQKIRSFVDSSVAANRPLLDNVKQKALTQGDISLAVHAMLDQSLELNERLPKNLVPFGRKVATSWDKTSWEEKEEAGLDPELCRNTSPGSTYFSNAKRGNSSFGILLDLIETRRSMIKRWKLLQGLRSGKIPFEKVQDFFLNEAQECLKLTSFDIIEDGVRIVGERAQIDEKTGEVSTLPGRIRLLQRNFEPNIEAYEEIVSLLIEKVANRLIVGYSPALH